MITGINATITKINTDHLREQINHLASVHNDKLLDPELPKVNFIERVRQLSAYEIEIETSKGSWSIEINDKFTYAQVVDDYDKLIIFGTTDDNQDNFETQFAQATLKAINKKLAD